MDIESRLKTALDESRLLILGAQVLFGFQFEAVFQELFPEISTAGRYIHSAGLVLLLASVCLLIAPSLFHQIMFDGESRPAAVAIATTLAGASLLPLTVGLGISAFVTFEHLFNRTIGIAAGSSFTAIALALLYGLGLALRRKKKRPMPNAPNHTPLKSKIEQMLSEGHHPGRSGAARLSTDRDLDQGVQRASGDLRIFPLRRAVRGRVVGRAFDDPRRGPPHRISWRGRSGFFPDRIAPRHRGVNPTGGRHLR